MAFVQDIRHAVRIFAATPGFAVAAILTLTLSIGANVAIFSVVYGVLVRPLPYAEPDRLVVARAEVTYTGTSRPTAVSIPYPELAAWQPPRDVLAAAAFHTTSEVVALATDSGSEVLAAAVVSPTFFSTLAGPIAAGRPLIEADGASPVVAISERLAVRLFGNPQGALNQTLVLTRHAYTVVGVADRGFQFPSPTVDVWLPASFLRTVNPRCCSFQIVARLTPDASLKRATDALRPTFERSVTAQGQGREIRTLVSRVADDIVGEVRPALLVLFAAVLMVLAIACGNLINLLLARNTARQREFTIRLALGAPAARLTQQLLVETGVLAVMGTLGGVLLAAGSLSILDRARVAGLPRVDAIDLDWTALLFAATLAALTTILTGIAPALRALRAPALSSDATERAGTPWRARRLQRTLCAVQVALAVMLLIGATLTSRSLVRLLNVDLGVTTDRVLTASLNLAFGERPTDAQVRSRIDRVIAEVSRQPGVQAAGVGTSLPPNASRMRVTLRRAGDVVDYQASAVPATPGYFGALQMRLIKGRYFTDADDDRHPQVMIMSEDTARRFFGTTDALGRTMLLPTMRDGVRGSTEMTLVGVTANVKYAGLAAPPDDIVYRPFAQQPWMAPFLVVQTTGDPAAFAQIVRRSIAAADNRVVVSSVAPLDDLVRDAAAQPQFRTVILATVASLAVGIAAIGLYGVVAYAVSRRTKEIGIRLALGATPREVLTMVLADGAVVAIAGIAAGTAAAIVVARLLTGLLYGIGPTDPLSFAMAGAGLFAVTLLASAIPAARAAQTDPVGALRQN